jgi:hypothetical protein
MIRGELPSPEQTTCSGNSRRSSVCLLARLEWNNRGQLETPAQRKSRLQTLGFPNESMWFFSGGAGLELGRFEL